MRAASGDDKRGCWLYVPHKSVSATRRYISIQSEALLCACAFITTYIQMRMYVCIISMYVCVCMYAPVSLYVCVCERVHELVLANDEIPIFSQSINISST